MTSKSCATPVSFAHIIDYLQGELPGKDEAILEEHIFQCALCTDRLEVAESIGRTIKNLAALGEIGGAVNFGYIEKARRSGLTIREYRLIPGMTVSCKAGSEDLVLVRLQGRYATGEEVALDIDFHNLEENRSSPTISHHVEVDHTVGEIVLVFPGEIVRNYPRSTWMLRAYSADAGSGDEIGTYILDHSP